MAGLTVLHTSDWHLGHQLYRKKRDQEFAAFLDWLSLTLAENKVDVLLVSGDIFDNGNPGANAQSLYFSFLGKIGNFGVRHVVIVAGNHDSPSFLNAAEPVLKNLNIHIAAYCPANMEDEILLLRDNEGNPELIVCAAPYLREGEICQFVPGESFTERENRLQQSLKDHFFKLAEMASELRNACGKEIPIIATAHLFTAGIEPKDEESSKEIYRGNLGCMPLANFPGDFDYVALGHIHRPYAVGGDITRRYSGSPLPLTFAEARYEKEIVLIHWQGNRADIRTITVPSFRKLFTIKGNSREIIAELNKLAAQESGGSEEIWIEILHDGTDSPASLPEKCTDIIKGSSLDILCIKSQSEKSSPESLELDHGLDELGPIEMFRRCLEYEKVPQDEWPTLMESFKELLHIVEEGDPS